VSGWAFVQLASPHGMPYAETMVGEGPVITDGKAPAPERQQTDESLRTEREEADRALAERQEAVHEDADLIVHRARENADAVLSAAREKADNQPGETASDTASRSGARLTEERVLEDQAVRNERASADEDLRRERQEAARALTTLLPLERDKTDRYLLTERARSDDALSNRDDFLGIVSHDLRDLLGGMVLSAALLSRTAPDSTHGKQTIAAMERIQRYAARMNRLIGDLVDVASIDAGKLAVSPAPGNATALLEEAVKTFEAAALAKGIALDTEMAEGPPLLVQLDHDRVMQVLTNLIANAMKFTADGGRIVVRAERAGDELQFTVSDTGSGIPESLLEAIFERFWQVGKNDRRGLGLGLYISRCIVQAHGGRIWAESKLGEGSSVRFTLPAS
jgi:signal transduction histidine kinase